MKPASARLLVGRRIIGFDRRAFPTGRGSTTGNPVIVLDNWARIVFSVTETESLAYGVNVFYIPDLG
jgi:hypothetical protein